MKIILLVSFCLFAYAFENISEAADCSTDHGYYSDECLAPKKALGLAIKRENQEFERLVQRLLIVSSDDAVKALTFPFGLKERHKFFSETGWFEYLSYISDHKKILTIKNLKKYERLESKAIFLFGSQEYKDKENSHIFKAELKFCYAQTHAYECDRKIKSIEISYKGDETNLETLRIQRWKVNFEERLENGSPH